MMKKNLQKELLAVEVANEMEQSRRMADYQNPYKPTVVPPQFKTSSELRSDKLSLEKEALANFEDLGLDYNKSADMTTWLGDIERLVKFNSSYKGIKNDIIKRFNPKLLTNEFLKNYLDKYFSDLEINLGHKFSDEIGAKTIEEVRSIIPSLKSIENLYDIYEKFEDDESIVNDIIDPLNDLYVKLPSDNLYAFLMSSLNQKERSEFARKLSARAKAIRLISANDIEEILKQLSGVNYQALENTKMEYFEGGLRLVPVFTEIKEPISKSKFDSITNRLKRALSSTTNANLNSLWNVYSTYVEELEKQGVEIPSELLENKDIDIDEEVKAILDEMPPIKQPVSIDEPVVKEFPPSAKEKKKFVKEKIEYEKKVAKVKQKNFESFLEEVGFRDVDGTMERIDQFKSIVEKIFTYQERPQEEMDNVLLAPNTDETMDILYEIIKEYYEEETSKDRGKYQPQKEPNFRVKYPDGRLSKYGVGMKAIGMDATPAFKQTRIKVGKGIEVQERPAFTKFGKYIINMNHLDKGILNVKYPSGGTVPAIRASPITEDYKEFIMELLESGKMNERMMKKLPAEEQKHFTKVVMGSGLADTFKFKRNDDEKEDVDRFHLLKGEIVAGNNAPKVVKEMRGLVMKFMEDGRITRNEGRGLLVDLSCV